MSDFLTGWSSSERSDKDVIKLKRVYIDMLDNLVDAVMFSQIMYWSTPAENGKSRLRVFRDGHWWIAKRYEDWQDECRVNERTARASIKRMTESGLLEKKIFHFYGKPWVHLRIVSDVFQSMIMSATQTSKPVSDPMCQEMSDKVSHVTLDDTSNCQEMSDTYTETTTETTKTLSTTQKQSKPKTQHNLMFEAICEVFGYDWKQITKSKRGQVNSATKELLDAGADIDVIPGLFKYCKRKFDTFGPKALATNYDDYNAQFCSRPATPSAPSLTGDEMAEIRAEMFGALPAGKQLEETPA